MRDVFVLGVGAHPWGKFPEKPMLQMLIEATESAMGDAGVGWHDINGITAASSRFEGGMGWGLHGNELEQAVAEKGVPIFNVTGGCAAGGVALSAAYMMVAGGGFDVVAAVGAEKMPKGFIPSPPGSVNDVTNVDYVRWAAIGATNPAYWALECQRRMNDFGTTKTTLAKASVLMHKNAVPNPIARYRKVFTVEEVLNSPIVSTPLHLYEICATSDGAAAVILGSKKEARKRGTKLISVAGCATATGQYGDPQMRVPNVSTPTNALSPHTSEVVGAVNRAFQMAGIGPKDIDFIELADNSSWQILAWPELFGFFEPGQSDWMLEHGELDVGGKLPVNPSGGFLSFGEATTAMGILQLCLVVWQLRGEARGIQVQKPKVGMTAVLGLGANGASVILKV